MARVRVGAERRLLHGEGSSARVLPPEHVAEARRDPGRAAEPDREQDRREHRRAVGDREHVRGRVPRPGSAAGARPAARRRLRGAPVRHRALLGRGGRGGEAPARPEPRLRRRHRRRASLREGVPAREQQRPRLRRRAHAGAARVVARLVPRHDPWHGARDAGEPVQFSFIKNIPESVLGHRYRAIAGAHEIRALILIGRALGARRDVANHYTTIRMHKLFQLNAEVKL